MEEANSYTAIPGFSKYECGLDGTVRFAKTGAVVRHHKSGGYHYVWVEDDAGDQFSIGVHRLIALAYLTQPDSNKLMTVNHKDGNKANNRADNLEWASYSENTTHAYKTGLRKDRIPVTVTRTSDGEVFRFYSKGEASKFLGIARSEFSTGKFKEKEFLKWGEFEIRFHHEDSFIPRPGYEFPTGIVARDIQSGNLYTAKNTAVLGRLTGVHPKVIRRILKGSKFKYPTNGYDFRVVSSEINWPAYSPEEIEAYKSVQFVAYPVWVVSASGDRKLFPSISTAANYTGEFERTVRSYMREGRPDKSGNTYIAHSGKTSSEQSPQPATAG